MPTRVSATPEAEDMSSPVSIDGSPAAGASQTLAVRGGPGARSVSGSKRKRTDTSSGRAASHRRRTAEPERESDGSEDSEHAEDEDEDEPAIGINDVYDPDQNVEARRAINRDLRTLAQTVSENPEEFMQKGGNLTGVIKQQNLLIKRVKRPGEAVSDSRLLVNTADLAHKKAMRLTHGSLAQGLDVDEFVSKCITYMRQGRGLEEDDAPELSSTQRRRRSRRDGNDDDEEDEGDMMNWAHLGRYAAQPYTRRPALPGFLLGPLSVEKKARKITKRSAPFRPQNLTETRPEVLSASDFAGKKKEGDLTVMCAAILRELNTVVDKVADALEEALTDEMSDEVREQVMHKAGMRETGGIDLLRFVVNPTSFGQTIENMFYVSFLIRDGRVAVEYDQHDYPSLSKFRYPLLSRFIL